MAEPKKPRKPLSRHERGVSRLRLWMRRELPPTDLPPAGELEDHLMPKEQRALGHLDQRRESVRLPSRHGYFRVKNVWGSYLFDNLFRAFLGGFIGFIVLAPLLVAAFREGSIVLLEGQSSFVRLLLGVGPPAAALIFFALRWRKRSVIRKRVFLWGLLFGTLHGLVLYM